MDGAVTRGGGTAAAAAETGAGADTRPGAPCRSMTFGTETAPTAAISGLSDLGTSPAPSANAFGGTADSAGASSLATSVDETGSGVF